MIRENASKNPAICPARTKMDFHLCSEYQVNSPRKNRNKAAPVRTHPTLYQRKPLGFKVEFPRSLNQFVTGENGGGNKASDTNVHTQ
jgi:hypothetical protein